MCGRYSLTEDLNHLQDAFDFEFTGELSPRYNIAPGTQILTIIAEDGQLNYKLYIIISTKKRAVYAAQ